MCSTVSPAVYGACMVLSDWSLLIIFFIAIIL